MNGFPVIPPEKTLKRMAVACLAIFVVLSLMHYFSQRPLWHDEKMILQNLEAYDGTGLFRRLLSDQAFPRVPLVAIDAISQPAGFHPLALRFFSLVFMTAAVFLWYRVYRRDSSSAGMFFLLMLSFACSYRLSYYAAELKHYAHDVFAIAAVAAFLGYANRVSQQKPDKGVLATSALLPFLPYFSYTSIFAIWIPAYLMFRLMKNNREWVKPLCIYLVLLVVCLVDLYAIDLKFTMGLASLHSYWQDCYLTFESASRFFSPLGEGIKRLAIFWYADSKVFIKAGVVFIPFFVYGLFRYGVKALKEEGFKIVSMDSLGLVLFLELLVLGILQKYPFTGGRITLFFAPFAFRFILLGLRDLKKIPFLWGIFGGYYVLYCLACLINTFRLHFDRFVN